MISKKEALEALDNEIKSMGKCKLPQIKAGLIQAREVINNIQTVDVNSKWIPIGQFPTEPVLLCFEDGTMAVGYYDEVDDVCISVGDSYYCSSEEPIAYMYLPESYKGE